MAIQQGEILDNTLEIISEKYKNNNRYFYKCKNNTVYSSISECCKSLDIVRRTFDRYKNQYGDRFIFKNYQIQIINE